MSRIRLLPLLLAVAVLPLATAGCGGDDAPSTAPAAAATPPAATTTTAAPTTTTAPPPTSTGTAPAAAPDTATTPTTTQPQPAANSPLDALKHYTKGGSRASGAQAAEVRDAFRAFVVAVGKQDTKTVCAHVIGFEAMLRASGQKGKSCEDLFKSVGKGASQPAKKDLEQIDKAQVTIKGDRATLSANGQTPMPMRKVDGVWKIDYTVFGDLASGGQK